MRVIFYCRNPAKGNYSIEKIFNGIAKIIESRVSISYFFTARAIDIQAIFKVRKNTAEVHHIIGAVNYLAFGLPARNTIITVHDIGHYTETLKGGRRLLYKYFFWVLPLRKAKIITAISSFTKQQLMSHFGIPEKKIIVIPNPVNPNFTLIPCRGNPIPVILQIGAGKNKNVESLVKAVRGLIVKLLMIRPPDPYLIGLLEEAKVQYEFRCDLSETDLVQAYAEADIVYFASTYEGFGLPILEGMATGRPVITSNISPMKEVALENALQVDPSNPEEIRRAIKVLMYDRAIYHQYQKRGLDHVKLFRADEIAARYYELYERIVDQ